jgi:hypothetical protein
MDNWKDVKGYEGFYKVSDTGKVRSVERYVNHPRIGTMLIKGRLLKHYINPDGYYVVNMSRDGKQKKQRTNRLVAQEFVANPHNKLEVNHINGIKSDNRVENLEWCTHKENMQHAHSNGHIRPSTKRVRIKKENECIDFPSVNATAEYIGCARQVVSSCLKKKRKNINGWECYYIKS